jgi:hypothetical protein
MTTFTPSDVPAVSPDGQSLAYTSTTGTMKPMLLVSLQKHFRLRTRLGTVAAVALAVIHLREIPTAVEFNLLAKGWQGTLLFIVGRQHNVCDDPAQ